MRTLAHLSDLHFGRVDATLLGPLRDAVHALHPDLVVVSGDLTQRARRAQFTAARDFLQQLPSPRIVVPGNHDVPLYDVARRFLSPLTRFRQAIEAEAAPWFADAEIAVLGLNSARSLTFKGGRINPGQVALVQARFATAPTTATRILVTHHPFEIPPDADPDDRIGRADMALRAFDACRVDLLLSGHLHRTHAAGADAQPGAETSRGHAAVSVHAGTATSTRGRGEANSFNAIRIEPGRIVVEIHAWDAAAGAFRAQARRCFVRGGHGWREQRARRPEDAGIPPHDPWPG